MSCTDTVPIIQIKVGHLTFIKTQLGSHRKASQGRGFVLFFFHITVRKNLTNPSEGKLSLELLCRRNSSSEQWIWGTSSNQVCSQKSERGESSCMGFSFFIQLMGLVTLGRESFQTQLNWEVYLLGNSRAFDIANQYLLLQVYFLSS